MAEEIAEEVVDEPNVEEAQESREPTEPKWPDNWREQLAGDDEKALKQLKRYGTPQDVWKKTRSLESRLSSGEYKMALPDEPSDEDLKAFREANGIPLEAKDYDTAFEPGFVVGDEDKEMLEGFLENAHKSHLSNDQLKDTLRWYYDEQERLNEQQQQRDEQAKDSAEDTLRAEWGKNYRSEMGHVGNFLSSAPEELRDRLLGGRLADGTPIGSSPDFLMWMNYLARQVAPMSSLTGPEGADAMKTLESRINEINTIMREDRKRYNREKLDVELQDLIEKRELIKGRAA